MRYLLSILFLVSILSPFPLFASGFVGDSGTVFAKVGFQTSTASEKFAGIFDRDLVRGTDIGDAVPFDPSTGGEASTFSLHISTLINPLDRWEIGAYFPFYQVSSFRDDAFDSKTVGVGDLFLNSAYQVTEPGTVATKIEVRGKIPLTELPAEFQSIPLGDGQFDIAIGQETSWAVIPKIHLSFSTLFRKRFPFKDEPRIIKFGDEFELGSAVGGSPWQWLSVSAGYKGLFSVGTVDRSGQGAATLRDRQNVHELAFSTYFGFGKLLGSFFSPFAIDASVRLPIAGQDYPIAFTYTGSIAYLERF